MGVSGYVCWIGVFVVCEMGCCYVQYKKYNLNTWSDCSPTVKAVAFKNKTYAIYSTPDMGLYLDAAFHFCQQLSPAGELVLPVDAESNDVVHELAKQSE